MVAEDGTGLIDDRPGARPRCRAKKPPSVTVSREANVVTAGLIRDAETAVRRPGSALSVTASNPSASARSGTAASLPSPKLPPAASAHS